MSEPAFPAKLASRVGTSLKKNHDVTPKVVIPDTAENQSVPKSTSVTDDSAKIISVPDTNTPDSTSITHKDIPLEQIQKSSYIGWISCTEG